jgi:hypothetical protein
MLGLLVVLAVAHLNTGLPLVSVLLGKETMAVLVVKTLMMPQAVGVVLAQLVVTVLQGLLPLRVAQVAQE